MTALDELFRRELERFEREHPRSRELARDAEASLLAGVPMPWMVRWAGGFPIFAAEAVLFADLLLRLIGRMSTADSQAS